MLNTSLYPWHEALYRSSIQRHLNHQLPHASLFYGDSDADCESIIHHIAAGILCKQALEKSYLPCGACASCTLLAADNHPDFHRIAPKDEAPIGIDMIRPLISECAQTATLAGARVIVIEHSHKMNTAASNALLKCLEEPNKGVIFLLASNHCQRLLPTILSRLQKTYVSSPSSQELRNYFPEIAEKVSGEIDLTLIKKSKLDPDYPSKMATFKSLFSNVMRGSVVPSELSQQTDPALISDGFRHILIWMNDVMKSSLGQTSSNTLIPIAGHALGEWCDYYRSGLQLWQLFQYNNSVNKRLLLDGFLIKLRKFYKEATA